MATTPKPNRAGKARIHRKAEKPIAADKPQVPVMEQVVAVNHALSGITVPVWARGHSVIDACPQQAGLRPLIGRILIAAKAFFPLGGEELAPAPGQEASAPEFITLARRWRKGRMAVCLTANQVHRMVQVLFGEGVRYPLTSVKSCLSAMVADKLCGVIRPDSADQPNRASKATLCLYFLNSTPPPPRLARRGFQAAPMPQAKAKAKD